MKNSQHWRPSKYQMTRRGLRASRDLEQVGAASRLVTDLLAPQYEQLLQAHARGRLLDLGCGGAPLYEVYQGLTSEVVCVDRSSSLHGLDYVDVEADLNGPLPFGEHEFDTVLSTDVLEHLEEPDNLFREAARVLKPDGKLLLATPFLYWIHEAPHDFGRYTSFMLERFCQKHGLEVLELRATGGSPEVLLDMVGRHLAWSDALTLGHARLASLALKLPGARWLSSHSQRWFPLGFILVARRQLSP